MKKVDQHSINSGNYAVAYYQAGAGKNQIDEKIANIFKNCLNS